MAHGGRRDISLALSGGGTRSALLSGGFLLAVQQAAREKKVSVEQVHAVSGSSLLLASIIIADQDNADNEFEGKTDQGLLMMTIENIARNGFAGRPVAKATLSAVATAVAASAILGFGFRPVTELGLSLIFAFLFLVLFVVFLWTSFRYNPFFLWASKNPLKNFRQVPKHCLLKPSKPSGLYLGFLPAGQLHFGATSSEDGKAAWFEAHGQPKSEDGSEATFGQLVKVSAAFPLVVGFEEIDGVRYIDGGVSDNTAMSADRKSGSVVY